jgi:DNA replication factor GINS
MNLEELRSVQRSERQKDSLQHLRDSFYEDVADYVRQLKDERERAVAAADDPFASEDVRQLTDKIESTQEIANALYERRVGKVVKHASFAAADMATDEDGMTTEERELFDDLVARIRENRETVMATLEGRGGSASTGSTESTEREPVTDTPTEPTESVPDAPATDELLADALGDDAAAEAASDEAPPAPPDTPDSSASESGATRPTADTAAVSGGPGGEEPPQSPASSDSARVERVDDTGADDVRDSAPERTTLRITADVGTVYGVDEREYDLACEDVVMLPTTNAEPLLEKDAAERID